MTHEFLEKQVGKNMSVLNLAYILHITQCRWVFCLKPLKSCRDKRHIRHWPGRGKEKCWKPKSRSVPTVESFHNHKRQAWVFQVLKKKHPYIHKRAQEFSVGVGNNNRKAMTLGWRLETEQLGHCMETADFCTGSNHCWLEAPNPCLYFFLSLFCTYAKLPRPLQTHNFAPSPATPGCMRHRPAGREQAGQAETPRDRSVPARQLPGDTGLKGAGSAQKALWGWDSRLFGSEPGIRPSVSHQLWGLVPRYLNLRRNFYF